MKQTRLTFVVYQDEVFVRRHSLTTGIVKIGQDPKSHLPIADPRAARMHAVIEATSPESLLLVDLGNGTRLNGSEIVQSPLRVGDQIEVGNSRIVLESASVAVEGAQAQSSAPFEVAAAPNPFATATPASLWGTFKPTPAVDGEATPDADTGYALIKSGPDVRAEEVELAGVASVEVMVLWGDNVLQVAHLTPPRPYYVGEEESQHLPLDYFIPQEKLGTSRLPLVTGDANGVSLVIPPGAKGRVELPGQQPMDLDAARDTGQPCLEVEGGRLVPLPNGGKGRIEVGDFVFRVAVVAAGKPIARGLGVGMSWEVPSFFGLSTLAVGSFMAAVAFFVPTSSLLADEELEQDRLYLIQQYLKSSAEHEQQDRPSDQVADEAADEREGGTGAKAKLEEGSMGNQNSRASNRRYGIEGDEHNPDPHVARERALREAENFGMIGLLASAEGGDPNAPTAPWGRDKSLGNDPVSALGNMWGDEIGDAFGAGGLGLTGIGEGGGGRGEGIGLGNVGTFGHGAGTGTNQGFGAGAGRLGRGHTTRAPQTRIGQGTVSGRLPPEVIQRIVRQNYGRFRMCYEQGLARNPNLEGRVEVRFVINSDGSVAHVSNGGSDLPDSGVVSCVVSAYYGLSFPQPEGGIVTVAYPIMFSPG